MALTAWLGFFIFEATFRKRRSLSVHATESNSRDSQAQDTTDLTLMLFNGSTSATGHEHLTITAEVRSDFVSRQQYYLRAVTARSVLVAGADCQRCNRVYSTRVSCR